MQNDLKSQQHLGNVFTSELVPKDSERIQRI